VLIVDDISPLRQLTSDVIEQDVVILKSRPVPVTGGHYGGSFPSAGGFVGPNSGEQAPIIYYLKDRVTTGDVKVEIFDKDGKSMGPVPATKRKGINVINWSMRMKPPKTAKGVRVDGAGFTSPLVEPGTYTVKLTKGDKVYTGTIELVKDPMAPYSSEDIAAQHKVSMEIYKMTEDLAYLNQQVINAIDSSKSALNALVGAKDFSPLRKSLQTFIDKLEKVHKELVATKGGQSITGEERIREKLSTLYWQVVYYEGKPSTSQVERIKSLTDEMQKQEVIFEAIKKNDFPKINAQLRNAKLAPLATLTREAFDKHGENSNQPLYPK
jgi:hypothetical protein